MTAKTITRKDVGPEIKAFDEWATGRFPLNSEHAQIAEQARIDHDRALNIWLAAWEAAAPKSESEPKETTPTEE